MSVSSMGIAMNYWERKKFFYRLIQIIALGQFVFRMYQSFTEQIAPLNRNLLRVVKTVVKSKISSSIGS